MKASSLENLILIDTNIWVDHFQFARPQVSALLDAGRVVMHPYIVAELALGGLHDRHLTLGSLELLPMLPVAALDEVRQLIELRKLYTVGIGFVDAHLLASLVIVQTPTEMWTSDVALRRAAESFGFRADPPF
ncbi:MAG: PIN domain-containing protein [Terracidiphilus sp.]